MAAARIIAAAAMQQHQRDRKTDAELMEELEEENKAVYNPFLDEGRYSYLAAKLYIRLAQATRTLTHGKYEPFFSGFIMGVICLAGVLVGMQTYKSLADDPILSSLDMFVLVAFSVEFVLKIVAEGLAPWRYYCEPWNNFDFVILLFSMPFFSALLGDGSVAVLRLFRLARVTRIIRKIPQLQMIAMGLVGGLSSIGYIVLLLCLIFYLYAIVGIYAFRDIDPWHFGNVPIAMITLFRAATLEDWTDIMYVQMFGCDEYAAVYVPPGAYNTTNSMYHCEDDMHSGQPWISPLYWISFIVISALVMLSLFVGAVTMAMSESMADMKEELEEQSRKEKLQREQEKLIRLQKELDGDATPDTQRKPMTLNDRERLREQKQMRDLLLQAWQGVDMSEALSEDPSIVLRPQSLREWYTMIAYKARTLSQSSVFTNTITSFILLAGVLVGLQTDDAVMEDIGHIVAILDIVVLSVFTAEVVIKIVAEEVEPLNYFKSPWNTFDFVIVVGSFIPGGGSSITMLRLLRLLRVLKLVKSLPQLAIIVNALIMGLSSIGFIGVILFLCFYVFAILGMLLFRDNDPWHFGSLHVAMLTLFRISTLEDWTDVMYINIYGCKLYGYDDEHMDCDDSRAMGAIAALYFVVFVVIGALVLLTLFIGVVTTSMEEATEQQKAEEELDERIQEYATAEHIPPETVYMYRKVFTMLDLDGGGTIEQEELMIGLKCVGLQPSRGELAALMGEVDDDGSGEIDMCEFIEFMTIVKKKGSANIPELALQKQRMAEAAAKKRQTPKREGSQFALIKRMSQSFRHAMTPIANGLSRAASFRSASVRPAASSRTNTSTSSGRNSPAAPSVVRVGSKSRSGSSSDSNSSSRSSSSSVAPYPPAPKLTARGIAENSKHGESKESEENLQQGDPVHNGSDETTPTHAVSPRLRSGSDADDMLEALGADSTTDPYLEHDTLDDVSDVPEDDGSTAVEQALNHPPSSANERAAQYRSPRSDTADTSATPSTVERPLGHVEKNTPTTVERPMQQPSPSPPLHEDGLDADSSALELAQLEADLANENL